MAVKRVRVKASRLPRTPGPYSVGKGKRNWRKVLDWFFEPGVAKRVKEELLAQVEAMKAGSDPIEAMHGHRCNPNCWHEQLKKVAKPHQSG
jgi:hypothetical protein